MSASPSCVIVGAGMAGLTAGRVLQTRGWNVVLLDKGRRAGGRMATRRIGASRFDHGAQFFTVRDPQFQDAVQQWISAGWVIPWFAEGGHVRYRAVGGMNDLPARLADDLDVRTGTTVQSAKPVGRSWHVLTDDGVDITAGALLLTAPAPQTLSLLGECAQELPDEIAGSLEKVDYDPCFALLALVHGNARIPFPGYVRLDDGPLEWIADNTQKGVSTGETALTIHARADFSRRYLDSPKEEVAALLLDAANPWLNSPVTEWHLHRWRYSRPVGGDRPVCLFTQVPACLAIAGDAFGGSRVEGAFLSGLAAAERLAANGESCAI
jgi:predicted NAD/FAD-dependent oxidoreductase